MKAEKLYELALVMYSQLDPYEKDRADNVLNGKYEGYTTEGKTKKLTPYDVAYAPLTEWTNLGANVGELIRVIKNEMAAEETKRAGKADQAKLIKAILKESQIRRKETDCDKYDKFCYTYIENGYQYVAGSYRIFRFVNPISNVPVSENEEDKAELIRVFDNNFKNKYCYDKVLETPDIAKLKAYIKRKTAENKLAKVSNPTAIIYCFGDIEVDANGLAEFLEFMPEAKICYNGNQSSPIFFSDENGNEAMMLPVCNKNNINLSKTEL